MINDYTIEEKIFDSLNYNIMKKTERKGEDKGRESSVGKKVGEMQPSSRRKGAGFSLHSCVHISELRVAPE